jgi:hypothetical protein
MDYSNPSRPWKPREAKGRVDVGNPLTSVLEDVRPLRRARKRSKWKARSKQLPGESDADHAGHALTETVGAQTIKISDYVIT